MGKISRLLLSSLAIATIVAQDYEVTSCDDLISPDKPAVSVKIAEHYFNKNFHRLNSLSSQNSQTSLNSLSSSFNLVNGFYERTFEQDILDQEFDDTTDGRFNKKKYKYNRTFFPEFVLSYTLEWDNAALNSALGIRILFENTRFEMKNDTKQVVIFHL